MSRLVRGRLDGASAAPAEGERHEVLAEPGRARVEQILTGALAAPQRFVGDVDEWVVLLSGGARLEAGGAVHELAAGDWVMIPAGEPHVLLDAEPGTVWLAVHGCPPPAATPLPGAGAGPRTR